MQQQQKPSPRNEPKAMDDDAVQYESRLKYVDPTVDTTPSGTKDYVPDQYTEDRGGRHHFKVLTEEEYAKSQEWTRGMRPTTSVPAPLGPPKPGGR
jgi:hypothetical protein